MKRIVASVFVLLLAGPAVVSIGCGEEQSRETAETPVKFSSSIQTPDRTGRIGTTRIDKESDFLIRLNAERTKAGLPALLPDPILVQAARVRSTDMADNNYFSHTAPDGTTVFNLLDSWGVLYGCGWGGENLARNNHSDGEAVVIAIEDLMASQGHRDNILNSHYTRVGVGYATDGNGKHYFTTVFAD